MQRRQVGNASPSSGDGVARRSLMNPFAVQSTPFQSSNQQSSTYLQYPGMAAPTTSLRRQQEQQSESQHVLGRFWQPAATTEPPAYGRHGQQPRHGGSFDLGFNDMLDTPGGSSGGRSRSETTESQEISMTGFDLNSFHDGATNSSQSRMASGSEEHVAPTQRGTLRARPPAPKTPSSTEGDKQTGAEPADAEETLRMVNAVYSQLNGLEDDPDLAQHKLDDKNERCDFHSCPNRARVSQAYGKFCNRHVIVAPCGFPGCRDKAADQAVMCSKHLKEGKEALYNILTNRPQNVPVCRQFGCFKNDQGRGYCRGHEKLLMATGRLPPHVNKRRLNSAYTMCSYPDCSRHSQRNHLCRTHGNLVKNQAQELADQPGNEEKFEEILDRMQKEIRRCTHENCTKNSQRDRLCTLHYYEKNKLHKATSGASEGSVAEGKIRAIQMDNDGNDVRLVERTRCSTPGCGNLSYAAGLCVEHVKQSQSQLHYSDSFSAGGSAGVSMAKMEKEAKPSFHFTGKIQANGTSRGTTSLTGTATAADTRCNNPTCTRESYGRDYCDTCQNLFFAPLVVSVGDAPPSISSYSSIVSNPVQTGGSDLPCRVKTCELDAVRGGLCDTHFRAFQTGSLSVDQLSLDSQQQRRDQELANAAAVAAAAAEAKQASPTASGKLKKYLCKVDKWALLKQSSVFSYCEFLLSFFY